jgi:hypothetical protein
VLKHEDPFLPRAEDAKSFMKSLPFAGDFEREGGIDDAGRRAARRAASTRKSLQSKYAYMLK